VLLRGINSNTLTILVRHEPEPVTCGNADAFRALLPVRPRKQDPTRGKPSSTAKPNDGHQAVALPGGRCSSANIRSYTTAAGTMRQYPGAAAQPTRWPSRPFADVAYSVRAARIGNTIAGLPVGGVAQSRF